tara:strand:+ start:660 stop:1100 length:441 start_codon:yes stop_codon:yes gene_type:complete
MKKFKIGWQKYEDVIESQINSPIIEKIQQVVQARYDGVTNIEDLDGLDEETLAELELQQQLTSQPVMISLDDEMATEINIASNFDCWVAHTNFNLTEKIKNQLDRIEGVELLKVYSRYRFLVGIGRMFDFKDVRRKIESKICHKGD